jgi:hypothetical protein
MSIVTMERKSGSFTSFRMTTPVRWRKEKSGSFTLFRMTTSVRWAKEKKADPSLRSG